MDLGATTVFNTISKSYSNDAHRSYLYFSSHGDIYDLHVFFNYPYVSHKFMDLGATLWLLTSSKRSNDYIMDYQGSWFISSGDGLFKSTYISKKFASTEYNVSLYMFGVYLSK